MPMPGPAHPDGTAQADLRRLRATIEAGYVLLQRAQLVYYDSLGCLNKAHAVLGVVRRWPLEPLLRPTEASVPSVPSVPPHDHTHSRAGREA